MQRAFIGLYLKIEFDLEMRSLHINIFRHAGTYIFCSLTTLFYSVLLLNWNPFMISACAFVKPAHSCNTFCHRKNWASCLCMSMPPPKSRIFLVVCRGSCVSPRLSHNAIKNDQTSKLTFSNVWKWQKIGKCMFIRIAVPYERLDLRS